MYSQHEYLPNESGACTNYWFNNSGKKVICRSTQASSVLHISYEAEFREMHWHDGRDCMCFESEDGPDYYEAMKAYVASRKA